MPDRCLIIPRPPAAARQESPDQHPRDGRSSPRDGEVPVMTAGVWWTEILVCPRLRARGISSVGQTFLSARCPRVRGILAPPSGQRLLEVLQKMWAGSGGVNATAR